MPLADLYLRFLERLPFFAPSGVVWIGHPFLFSKYL